MITIKCQSDVGEGDTLEIDEAGGFDKPELSFISQSGDDTAEIIIDLEQAAKLGAALTAWAKRHASKANDPKKYVGSI